MDIKIVKEFVENINRHDIASIGDLMAEEHKFIDSHGNIIYGKDNMTKAWEAYFDWSPDYLIEITDIVESEKIIGLFGFAEGTYKGLRVKNNEYHWRLPATWKTVVSEGKVQLWQVFADTKIPYDIMTKEINY
jgi:ketosteroid isomerase-like protein